jgi:tetratricopeptide (TPR) repeat protein
VIGDRPDTLGTLSALVDKSLVVAETQGTEARYSMLDVIAEFAVEQAERHRESDALHDEHARFFLALAERADLEAQRSGEDRWHRRLALEHGNFKSALRWAHLRRDPELELRLVGALWRFWRVEGHYSEGRAWIEEALSRSADGPAEARATAMWGAAWLAFHQDDLRAARRFSAQLTALSQQQELSIIRRNALTVEAMLHLAEGRFEDSIRPLRESVRLCEANDPGWLLATSKLNLALASIHTRRLKDASRLLEEASNLYLALGDERFLTRAHVYEAHLRLIEGNRSGAEELFNESLQHFLVLGDQHGVAESVEGLAAVSAANGATRAAALLWGTASQLREESSTRPLPFERSLIDPWLDEAKVTLGDQRWDEVISSGRGLDVEQSLAETAASRAGREPC